MSMDGSNDPGGPVRVAVELLRLVKHAIGGWGSTMRLAMLVLVVVVAVMIAR
jgi:hypothetical protein